MRLLASAKLFTAVLSSFVLLFHGTYMQVHRMHTSWASWYYDYGATASGRHYTFGFASLMFGNQWGKRVRFCYRRRCLIGRLDDHGPYVRSRKFDLNQNIARTLHFEGVHKIHWRVI